MSGESTTGSISVTMVSGGVKSSVIPDRPTRHLSKADLFRARGSALVFLGPTPRKEFCLGRRILF